MTRRFGEPDPDGVDAGAQDTAVVGSRRVAEVTVQFTHHAGCVPRAGTTRTSWTGCGVTLFHVWHRASRVTGDGGAT